MNQSIYTGLINNAALLLVLTVLYDVFILRWQQKRGFPQKIITGSLVATICIGLMLNPWQLAPGIFFDTRSVLLSITGLYFGTIPAVTAAIITSAFRIFQGGSGMYMGVLVIITTTALGIAWRYKRSALHANPRWTDLYLFGIVVHITMLICTVALPQESRQSVFNAILLPVLTIYPVATMMLGLIINSWIDRQQVDERLRESDARWQLAMESADAGVWDLDLPSMQVRFSKQGRALLGYQPFEHVMAYQKWLDMIHPDDRARSDEEMQAVISGKAPLFMSERRVKRADGSYMWVMTRGRVSRRDENGKALQITGITTDISAQMNNEADRQRMFEIINASPTEVYILDSESLKFEYVSAGALRNLGYPLERMRQMTPVDIATEFDYDSLAALLAPLQRGQINQLVFETTHQRANGTLYPIEVHLQLFKRQEKPVYFAIALDISERRKKDSQIEHMASFPRFNPNPVLEIDPHKGIIFQNEATGKTFPDLRKLGWEHPALRDVDLQNVPAREDIDNLLQGECEVDGRWFWETAKFHPDTSTWRLYMVEITPTKLAEQATREKSAELDQFFTTALDLLCIANLEGKFIRLNPQWEQVLGYDITDLLGTSFLQLVHPDEVQAAQAALARLSSQESLEGFINRYRCKDGSYRWIEWHSHPVGNLIYATARDITEQRETQAALELSNRRLQRLLDASQALSQSLETRLIFNKLVNFLRETVLCDALAVAEFDQASGLIRNTFGWGSEKEVDVSKIPPSRYNARGAGAQCRVIKSKQSLLLNDFEAQARASAYVTDNGELLPEPPEGEMMPRSAMFVPLLHGSQVKGVIQVLSSRSHAYTEEDLRVVEGVAAQMVLALENAALFERVQQELAERKLVEDERLLLADVINDSVNEVYIFDAYSLKFINVNQGARRNLGFSMAELEQMTPLDLKPDFSAKDFNAIIKPLRSHTRNLQVFETRHLRKDGSFYDVEVRLQLFDKHKKSVFLAVIQDVTERKQAELALIRSERNLRKAQQVANVGSWVWHIATNMLEWSDQMYTIFGIDKSQFSGSLADVVASAIHPDDRAAVDASNRLVVEQNRPTPLEYRVVRQDGSIRTVWAEAGELLLDEHGQPRSLSGIVQDITERKQAEIALRESEKRFRVAQEMSPDGFTILHPLRNEQGEIVDFVWLYENLTIAQINNTDATEIKGKRLLDLFPSHKGTSIFETYIQVANTGNPQIIEEVYVGEVLSKPTYLRLVVVSMGEDIAILAQDITERRKAESLIRDMNVELEARVKQRTAQLESTNMELEAFSYSVSHDLRAPLRAIDGFVSMLEEDYTAALDDEARRLVGVIRANTHSMGQLIDDLLRYSRMTRADMVIEEVDMAGLVRSVYFELTKERERQRVDLRVGRLPRVQGDPSMLRQVWMNLIGNALKFTSKREQAVIKVSSRRENGQVIFCVEDNGAGFDMQYADKLFNVFQRLHSNAEFEGTGVGLAIMKRIILRHAGRVWAQASVDAGAKFYLSLPDTQKGLKNGKEL